MTLQLLLIFEDNFIFFFISAVFIVLVLDSNHVPGLEHQCWCIAESDLVVWLFSLCTVNIFKPSRVFVKNHAVLSSATITVKIRHLTETSGLRIQYVHEIKPRGLEQNAPNLPDCQFRGKLSPMKFHPLASIGC